MKIGKDWDDNEVFAVEGKTLNQLTRDRYYLQKAPLPPGRFTRNYAMKEWIIKYEEWYSEKSI